MTREQSATNASAAVDAERRLHDPDVRRDRDQVEILLDVSFREIGRSGRLWTREATVEALSAEPSPGPTEAAVMTQLHIEHPSPDLVLLTYALEVDGVVTRRSSLWRVQEDGAQLLFHQGTPAPLEGI